MKNRGRTTSFARIGSTIGVGSCLDDGSCVGSVNVGERGDIGASASLPVSALLLGKLSEIDVNRSESDGSSGADGDIGTVASWVGSFCSSANEGSKPEDDDGSDMEKWLESLMDALAGTFH